MKGAGDIISTIQHLKIAKDHMESFCRGHPGSKGEKLFKGYQNRISFVFSDLITNPLLPDIVRDGIKREWNSDVYATTAIVEKIALLSPDKREFLETVADGLLSGEKIEFQAHE